MTALAIDLGTTACKASVVTVDGVVLGSATRRVDTIVGEGGAAEQDAERTWSATLGACREALATAGPAGSDGVEVVCAAAQWASLVPVGADGHPVAPMSMWFDDRGSRLASALVAGDRAPRAARWVEVHGFVPGTSLGHLLRFQRDPAVHERCAAYLEPVDYLNARLTGRLACTANSAMPLALTDNRTLGAVVWSDELIDYAGVDRTRLPEIVPSLSVLGALLPSVADDLGLPPGVTVAAGANDSIASAFGSAAIEPGAATIMLGTTGVLVTHHVHRHVDTSRFIVTMPSALDDRYYVVAEAGLGGKLLEVALAQVVGTTDDGPPSEAFEATMALAAASPPGAGGVLFLPWALGALAPAPEPRHRGALLGLSITTTRADVARALLEGVALQLRWLVDEVEAATGLPFGAIRFVGGGAQSELWSRIMADVIGRPIEQMVQPRHANARGAAFMGLIATGRLTIDDLPSHVAVEARYEPDPSLAPLYAERLEVVRELHRSLVAPVARLARTANAAHEPWHFDETHQPGDMTRP